MHTLGVQMSTVLLIHTYAGANEAMARHWEFFKRAGADQIVAVVPVDGGCRFPEHTPCLYSGDGKYMDGPNLCHRLVDTLRYIERAHFDKGIIVEYDTLVLKDLTNFSGLRCNLTGGQTWGSKATFFSHNPWCVEARLASEMAVEGLKIINEGICAYGTPESSPDVFLGLICDRLGIKPDHSLKLFTRNTIINPEDVGGARVAFLDGYDAIHGVKSEEIFNAITGHVSYLNA